MWSTRWDNGNREKSGQKRETCGQKEREREVLKLG